MGFVKPSKLGIIACPGGEYFANEMIPHLKKLYVKRGMKKASIIASRYNLTQENVLREMNLISDINSSKIEYTKPVDTYRPPVFKLPVKFTRFANGEYKAELQSSIRDQDIYIIQDVENKYPLRFYGSDDKHRLSVNDHVMTLFVTIDAAIQAGARSITLFLPTFPFARQHQRKGREALTAAWFGRTCEDMGVSRIITLDIHSKEIENCFKTVSLENLHASYQIIRILSKLINLKKSDLVVVSPDTGAIDRNKFYAGHLNKPLAMLYKERDYSKVSMDANASNIKNSRLLGSVKNKIVLMADDMLGTGGTMIKAMELLKEMGAEKIICAISLPFFTGDAMKYFDEGYKNGLFFRIIGTNAVYHDSNLLNKEWYISANVSNLFARVLSRLHHGRSLAPMLDNRRIIQKLLKNE